MASENAPPVRQVLVFASQETPFLSELAAVSKKSSSPFGVIALKLSQALECVDPEKYDAFVCVVERPEDLLYVVQLRKSASKTPLVVVTEPAATELQRKAAELGASAVLPFTTIRELAAGNVARSLQTLWLSHKISAQVKRTSDLSREIQQLAADRPRRKVDLTESSQALKLAEFAPILVEDNPDEALLLMRTFAKCRIPGPVEVLKDGEEAIAYLSGAPPYFDRSRHPLPSLLILDLKLPRLSGFEVLEWMRQDPRIGRIRVVVLSASRQEEDLRRAESLGVGLYLEKPVDMGILEERVREIAAYWLSTL